MAGEAEQFLHPDLDGRAALDRIVDRHGIAGGGGEVAGQQGFDGLAAGIGQQQVERGPQLFAGDFREPGEAEQRRGEPVIDRRGQVLGAQIGPLIAQGGVKETGTGAPGGLLTAPGQGIDAAAGGGFGQQVRGGLGIVDRHGLVGQFEGVELAAAAGADAGRGSVKAQCRA